METKDDWKLNMKNIRDLMQEHFDTAVSGILLQGKQAFQRADNGVDMCAYRIEKDDEVLFCAVGQLVKHLPQEKIAVIEGTGAYDIYYQEPKIFREMFMDGQDYSDDDQAALALMLQALQEAHDDIDVYVNFREVFFSAAEEVAVNYRLKFDFDSADWF